MKPAERIILALDFGSQQQALKFLPNLPELRWVKVGMQLFYSAGPEIVYRLKEKGYQVFLDLKLHDIPNTVSGATQVLSKMGVDMLNFHVSGGRKMLQEAVEAAASTGNQPLLIGVTQLTSTSQETLNAEIGINLLMEEAVLHYAKMAYNSGLDGVVCSAHETKLIKDSISQDFLTVTPGIRLPGQAKHDQDRVKSPAQAVAEGSDYLVIGRSLTQATDPAAAWEEIIRELEEDESND